MWLQEPTPGCLPAHLMRNCLLLGLDEPCQAYCVVVAGVLLLLLLLAPVAGVPMMAVRSIVLSPAV